jgi:hypothetical protein
MEYPCPRLFGVDGTDAFLELAGEACGTCCLSR